MKQFGETDINEFNYDTCCTIFRQLIQHVEKEMKVNYACEPRISIWETRSFLGAREAFGNEEGPAQLYEIIIGETHRNE